MSLFTDLAFTHIPDGWVLPLTIRAINVYGMSEYAEFNSQDTQGSAVAYSKPAQPIVPKTMV